METHSIRVRRISEGRRAIFRTKFILMQQVNASLFHISVKVLKLLCILVPLHVLYSYDDSSSDDERKDRSANRSQSHSQNKLLSPTNRALNKMPPVHKIVPRSSHGR